MVKVGFIVRLEVKPGKATELEARLKAALPAVEQEPGTTAWLAVRLGPTSYAVVDVFPDEAGRQAHLAAGRVRLKEIEGLVAAPPSIVPTDVIVAKLP
jgi:quinol monooxygenase YgiN